MTQDDQDTIMFGIQVLAWRFMPRHSRPTLGELAEQAAPECEGPRMAEVLRVFRQFAHVQVTRAHA